MNYQELINSCVYIVEATRCEELDAWERFHEDFKWENVHGWLETVGHLDNRPICISVQIVKINDRNILFWHATSQLVDYIMIDKWFEEHAPNIRKTDAMNIHNALHTIRDLNKAEEPCPYIQGGVIC